MTRGNILTEEEIARLAALPEKQRDYAVKIYAAREKKKSTAYILWIVFALYYFYLGHPVKNIIFWLLWSCLIGEIWWLIDLFRISDMVDETNEEILGTCIEEAISEQGIALLNVLTPRQKEYALTLYSGREKKKSTAYILWIVFAVYYFYLGHPVKNIIFWLLWTCFIGEIWWIIDLFRISGMVDRKNEEILLQCIAEARQLYPGVTGTMKVQIIKPDQTQE